VVSNTGVTVRQALVAAFARVRSVSHTAFEGRDWQIDPPEMARRARALFVRQAEWEPVVDTAPAPAVTLPLAPSRAELRARDSLLREQDRADSIARVVVATLRLPAEAGPRGGLARLLADAYRNALRADVAVVLTSETGDRLPARGLTAAEIEAAAPGDATLLSVRMTGEALGQLLENALAADNPCCEFSGIEVEYDPRGKPWDRVRRIRVKTTGKEIDRRATYLVALSNRHMQDDRFALAATDCRPSKGCRTAGTLAGFTVERTPQRPAEALRDYLRQLPQPVVPPDDRRLIPKR
jgi:hypothetical protein